MDYTETDGRQAAIALIRKPATVPSSSKLYRGPVLFNPGGPGGSGIGLVLSRGLSFAQILGPRFDIVGFDPRGKIRHSGLGLKLRLSRHRIINTKGNILQD